MRMTDGVLVTVTWTIQPELADSFVELLGGMFPATRLRGGFRSIRLLRSEADPAQFLLLEEWDEAQNFQDYAQFRNDTGDTAKLLAMIDGPPTISIWPLRAVAGA